MPGVRRILYVDLAPSVGGSVISLYQLVKGLDRSRYEPHVLLRASNGYVPRFRALGVSVIVLGRVSSQERVEAVGVESLRRSWTISWLKRYALGERLVHVVGFYVRAWPALRREAGEITQIIRTIKPDLVHLNDDVCVSRSGIMAARRAHVPAICHLRAMAWRNHFDRWISRWLRGYICISQAVDAHQRKLGGRVDPSWVVYNGLDLTEFDAPADRAELRAQWGLNDGDEIVACVGRLVAWKGQHVLIEALARLAPDRPRLRALIVGDAGSSDQGYAQELKDLARALGVEDRVILTGFRDDIASLLHGVDVLVHTSTLPEPFGRVIIEGMAAGAPVVGANAGAVPEIIQDGVNGLLTPPGDAWALAQAIARILDHPDEAQAMRQAARQAIETRFTTARYVSDVEHVYEVIWGD